MFSNLKLLVYKKLHVSHRKAIRKSGNSMKVYLYVLYLHFLKVDLKTATYGKIIRRLLVKLLLSLLSLWQLLLLSQLLVLALSELPKNIPHTKFPNTTHKEYTYRCCVMLTLNSLTTKRILKKLFKRFVVFFG